MDVHGEIATKRRVHGWAKGCKSAVLSQISVQTPYSTFVITPGSQISKHLDKYIVGQDSAKKTLSVAVFNHYHRIVHSREQAQASIDRTTKEITVEQQEEVSQASVPIKNDPDGLSPVSPSTPGGREGNRANLNQHREIRIESRITEPDPTKTHEPSTWAGEQTLALQGALTSDRIWTTNRSQLLYAYFPPCLWCRSGHDY
jgi:hypothetical protein